MQVPECDDVYHRVCKWSRCTVGKYHQHNMQLVATTTCARGLFAPGETPQAQGAKVRMQGAKIRASISASQYRMQQQHATTTTIITTQMQAAQHDAAITATCIRAMFVEKIVSPYTSCIDFCIIHITAITASQYCHCCWTTEEEAITSYHEYT